MKLGKRFWIIGALAVAALVIVYGVRGSLFDFGASENFSPRSQGLTFPSPDRVVMLDLGANECVPCKMMAPILEELKKEYAGRAEIIFIDVWKDPDQAKKYGIRAIPTQIFFNAEGREVHRNTGFMDKKRIVDILSRLGVS
ncbi:MAG: thioredoxin domain-containing protein [Desulfobacterales bacterium]|jgi:thioredoxin 1|nr:thioredoxin domain-containing protein [Desulfobacterales bacterium]MDD3082825.1 thioredoxin domain-containing protein [Desulfobacterales bacterium]MDD3951699.1 thioredoxin domain-containing protein [Desulfobacterales bacterium]MDD4463085.1 thioredoxin domain-containing protein [Desulfobacterales bacterium]